MRDGGRNRGRLRMQQESHRDADSRHSSRMARGGDLFRRTARNDIQRIGLGVRGSLPRRGECRPRAGVQARRDDLRAQLQHKHRAFRRIGTPLPEDFLPDVPPRLRPRKAHHFLPLRRNGKRLPAGAVRQADRSLSHLAHRHAPDQGRPSLQGSARRGADLDRLETLCGRMGQQVP